MTPSVDRVNGTVSCFVVYILSCANCDSIELELLERMGWGEDESSASHWALRKYKSQNRKFDLIQLENELNKNFSSSAQIQLCSVYEIQFEFAIECLVSANNHSAPVPNRSELREINRNSIWNIKWNFNMCIVRRHSCVLRVCVCGERWWLTPSDTTTLSKKLICRFCFMANQATSSPCGFDLSWIALPLRNGITFLHCTAIPTLRR